MMLERVSPLKSMDTKGSSQTPRMPFIGPSAASLKAAISSSLVQGLASSATKSTIETVGVGTRMAIPSNLPLRSGITNARALAAPVVVGMMFNAAARERRGSLCGRSTKRWSAVYECTVVIKPLTIPHLSCTTLAAGARQLVVQEALEMI